MTMEVDRISYSVERVINIGNYESVRIKAELGASTDDFKRDMKELKLLLLKSIDRDTQRIQDKYVNANE